MAISRLVHKRGGRELIEVPSEVVETLEYGGFTVEIHRLLQERRFCFMPLIKRGEEVVHRIFVRSKSPYVSREHLAKRAIDARVATGAWPEKHGKLLR